MAPSYILGEIAHARRLQRNADVLNGMLEFEKGDTLFVRKVEDIRWSSGPYLCIVLRRDGVRTTIYSVAGYHTIAPAFSEDNLSKFRAVLVKLLRRIITTVDDRRTVMFAEKRLAKVCMEAIA
jgi:hypothetical protein